MNQDFHPITDFTAYGNQPKVWAMATNVRSELWMTRENKKKQMKRSTVFNDVNRVNGRTDFCKPDAWYRDSLTRRGRSWVCLAPKSPADHWLKCQGYSQLPF